jgi:anaerobic magnesium-protoporphyrin IX monomethyl ester cyclase
MNVLLIHPPDRHLIRTNVPAFVDEETGCYPPIGLLYVAAAMLEQKAHQVTILDAKAEGLDEEAVGERIRAVRPDLIGIQTLTFSLRDSLGMARAAKAVSCDIKVVLGGPHTWIFPDETIAFDEVDFLVMGEGEQTFVKLVNTLDRGGTLREIAGLVFKDKGQVVKTPQRPLITDLDALPYPPREMLKINRYRTVLAKHSPITTMITTRGCPYRCIFCDRPHLGKKFRARSPESVIGEMEECKRLGIGEIFMYDDTFTIDRARVLAICDLIRRRKLDIGWDIRAHLNTVDEEMLRQLRRAGCIRIHYGVESGNPDILKVLQKDLDLARVKEIFSFTRKLGIQTLGYFMIGNPTETIEQINETIQFAKALDADFVHFSVTTPFPATQLYRLGLERGILARDYWREYARNPSPEFVPPLWEENLKQQQLHELLSKAYRAFYFRPQYLLRQTLSVRSPGEFLRKAKVGLRMLKV